MDPILDTEKRESKDQRSVQDVSFSKIRDMLRDALGAKYGDNSGDNSTVNLWIQDVYNDYIIYELAGKAFKLSYSLLNDQIVLADESIEVTQEWVDVPAQQAKASEDEFDDSLSMVSKMAQPNPEGSVWEVTICESGHTKNGWFLPDSALRAAADQGLFEGIDVCLYELPTGATHLPDQLFDLKQLLVKNKVGWLSEVRHVAGNIGKLVGKISFLDSAKWLGQNMLKAMDAGGKAYGLSYDAAAKAVKSVVDNKQVIQLTKFIKPDSLDIVTRPAAGGSFNRAIAAMQGPTHSQEVKSIMNKEQLWALIQKARPDLLVGKTLAGATDEEVTTLARMAMEPPQQDNKSGGDGQVQAQKTTDQQTAQTDTAFEIKLMRCEMSLDKVLDKSDLPDITKERIRGEFAGKVFEQTALDTAIGKEKDYISKMDAARPKDEDFIPAGARVNVGMGSYQRACMAVDRLFGLTRDQVLQFRKMETLEHKPFFDDSIVRSVQDCEGYDDVPAFTSLREMYNYFTGDDEVRGLFNRKRLPAELRSRMDITSATFSYVLGNTLGRRLVATYRLLDYGESLLVSNKKSVKDFRSQEVVKVGYFPSIDTVDPETADYSEIATVTDEEATYTIAQKGNILTISRKTIINDDTRVINTLVDRFGRAFRRTHGETVWAFWTDNATCTDTTAWHTSGHGNLGATAMSFTTVMVAYKALGKMTEKDSSKRIGLLDYPDVKPVLVYPIDLVETANTIVSDDMYYTGADDRTTRTKNPLYGKIEGRQLSHLEDTADWGLILPASIVDHVEMGYLNGREDPEFFVADSQQSEQVFVADKIRYKGRHEYNGTVVDYVGSYKAEVA